MFSWGLIGLQIGLGGIRVRCALVGKHTNRSVEGGPLPLVFIFCRVCLCVCVCVFFLIRMFLFLRFRGSD